MSDGDRLVELLVEWEERRRQGRAVTAEELCPGDSALQEALRGRLRQRERLRALWSIQEQTVHTPTVPHPQTPHPEGFEILGELGHGAMGVVYKARQTRLNRLVALKVVLAGAHAGSEELSRFRREAEATATLQHPNVVQVFEVGEHGGCPYLVLEYVVGGSLAGRLDGTPLPAGGAAELIRALAQAVQHAHQRGILHRDLKPANVLITEDGTPKIADFGLAKRLDIDQSQTRTGAILGTPSYMAPEQAEGKTRELSPATDVYALGAILYECLTGRPPFRAASVLETLEQVRSQEPVPPRFLLPKVPRDLEAICLKCLQKEPGKRYPTAEALAQDLERFLQGEAVTVRNFGMIDRLTRALEYDRFQGELLAWSTILLLYAAILVVFCPLFYALPWREFPQARPWLVSLSLLQCALALWIFWYFRWRLPMPLSSDERRLGLMWGVPIVADFLY